MRAADDVSLVRFKLLGCVSTSHKEVKDAVLYTMEHCEEDIQFKELPSLFSHSEVKDMRTIQSCQGTEFDEGLTILGMPTS